MEFAPKLVPNPYSTVTFKCDSATPLDLIRATGQQTRIPIGVVLGNDADGLSRPVRSYDLKAVDAKDALMEAIKGTGYSLTEKDHVIELIAGDVTSRQEELLTHRFSDFGGSSKATMVELGASLTGWIGAEVDGAKGFGASIGGSMNDERFTLTPLQEATTEEIADRIVCLGSKGMWIFRADGFQPGESNDKMEIESYQHYSNRPYIEP